MTGKSASEDPIPKKDAYKNPYCEQGGWIIQNANGQLRTISWDGGTAVEQEREDRKLHDTKNDTVPTKAVAIPQKWKKIDQNETLIGSYHTQPWSYMPSDGDREASDNDKIPGLVTGPRGNIVDYDGKKKNFSDGTCNKSLLPKKEVHPQ